MMSLKNKNVLVTGAGKGIGFACIEELAREGAFVFALVKSKKDALKLKKLNKRNIKIYCGNVKNVKLINKILNDSIKSKKAINSVVNNAGIRFRKKFLDISKNDLLEVFNVNFFSIFFISQIFLNFANKYKIRGSIVNISSIVGQRGFNELSAYSSSKGALDALTKSLSTEFANKNIRINSISPGFTKTSYYESFKKKTSLYKWTLSRIPMNRWGEPKEISNLICYLLSEKSSYITGENFNIDGGWLSS